MAKTKEVLVVCGSLAVVASLCGCGAAFEGSGSKDAASAEQLAQQTPDPWAAEIVVDPLKTADGNLQDGVYVGQGKGMCGMITVTLLVEDNHITCVAVTQEGETQGVGGYEAIRDGRYAQMIDAAQGADFDTISGATITTAGVRAATTEALQLAEAGETNAVTETGAAGETVAGETSAAGEKNTAASSQATPTTSGEAKSKTASDTAASPASDGEE